MAFFTTACPISREDCWKQFCPQMDHVLSFRMAGRLPGLFFTSALCRFLPLVLSGFAAPLSRKSGLGPQHPLAPMPTTPCDLAVAAPLSKSNTSSGQDRGHHIDLCPSPTPAPLGENTQKHMHPEQRSSQSLEKRQPAILSVFGSAWLLVYGTTGSIFSLCNRTNHFTSLFFSLDSIKAKFTYGNMWKF